MAVSIWVGRERYEVGAASFLKSLFSTIYVRLEDSDWGGTYPTLMNDFYDGELSPEKAQDAVQEIDAVARQLDRLNAAEIVWNFEDPNERPPWLNDDDYDPAAPAREYFLTSDGKDLLDVMRASFVRAAGERRSASIM